MDLLICHCLCFYELGDGLHFLNIVSWRSTSLTLLYSRDRQLQLITHLQTRTVCFHRAMRRGSRYTDNFGTSSKNGTHKYIH